jgi:hypothetical protein
MEDIIKIFQDNDQAYINWLQKNPRGYVLNCDRVPVASYLELHRANCSTISGTPPEGTYWTKDYTKACSRSKLALISWASSKTGGTVQFCSNCM